MRYGSSVRLRPPPTKVLTTMEHTYLNAEQAVVAMLNGITAENREPTAWEGECLRATLIMMAIDDYPRAGSIIDVLGARPSACPTLPASQLTTEDVRACLAMLRAWPSDSSQSERTDLRYLAEAD